MSLNKPRHDNATPALFPFLAVLLCTIGALVLILVIIVANARASVQRTTEQKRLEIQESTELMDVVTEELEAQRDKLKSVVERRRRDLANIEDHISRLTKNLEQLASKIERIQSEASDTEATRAQKNEQVAKLKDEIDAKKKELLEEIEKQKNSKPAFAIIPYTGGNGTTRRPVYLECTRAGVIVQPEGLLISVNELRPPLGPGNPLDAALRVLRLAYQQKDATFGITQPPYPLLIVRPDGIHTYALAREAMSGWDDQFGYELVEKDMELKFPNGVPGLKEQLVGTIDVAKRRQQALLASMPRRPVPMEDEDSWDAIDASNVPSPGPQGQGGGGGGGLGGAGNGGTAGGGNLEGAESAREWKLVQGLANSQVTGAIQRNGLESSNNAPGNGSGSGSPQSPSPDGAIASGDYPKLSGFGGADLQGEFTASGSPSSAQGTPMSGKELGQSRGQARGQGNSTDPNGAPSNGAPSTGAGGQQVAANGTGGVQAGNSSNGSNSGAMGQAGTNAGTPVPRMNAFSNGSATSSGNANSSSDAASGNPNDGSQSPNLAVSLSNDMSVKNPNTAPKPKHVNPDGDLKPISVSAGRGWAASRAEGKATPVSRPINIIALKDRWLIRSDLDSMTFDANINMEQGPQQAGEQLAVAIRKRVDSWGLSVPGGFWSPTITIESASDAQQSIDRLKRLLEGSGVEIQVVPLKLPNRR